MTPGSRGTRPDGRLVDDVHEAIKARIMDHAIAPGARVPIDGLARALGVSPTPVREALARLESAQLVVKEPLRGYRTTPLLRPDQLADLYRFRLLIEPWAAAHAAERTDDAGRARLTAELATADAPESDTYAAYRAFSAHDARFHLLVAELAGSDQVREAFQRTHWHLHIYRLHYDRGIGPQALAEHRRVSDAVSAGDPAAAAEAMRAHLESSHTRLRPPQ
ncbi:MAG TPA: GntR family transcriptional regulator [Pseudonocardia sp.]|nr:GntR family transcriptional regulator [Pseudonocardia sp.]